MPAAWSNARRRRRLFKKMRMPYTEALLAALPKIDAAPHTPLAGDLGAAAGSDPAAAGLLVLAALPLCGRPMPSREARRSPRLNRCDHQYACFHPIEVAAGVRA